MVGAFALSELAARWLDANPASAWAWMINAGFFQAFEHARVQMLPSRFLFGPEALPAAVALLALIMLARMVRSRLGLAIFANASFAAAASLAYAARGLWFARDVQQDAGLILVGVLLVTSFVASVASHWDFARAIQRDWMGRSAARDPEIQAHGPRPLWRRTAVRQLA